MIHNAFAWAGPAVGAKAVEEHKYVSPAASWWNRRLVEEIVNTGRASCHVVTHIPNPGWPKGPLRVSTQARSGATPPEATVDYWNLPGLRQISLARAYHQVAAPTVRQGASLVTYNPYPHLLALGRKISRAADSRWFGIFADRGSAQAAVARYRDEALKELCGGIYLSWHDYVAANDDGSHPALHLDGGVDLVRQARAFDVQSHPTVLYTGALNTHGGVHLLLESLNFLDPDIRVIVCGKGPTDDLRRTANDPSLRGRLDVRGMVSEEALHQLSLNASCFVNPRPETRATQHNFPSKILRYLGYGQPIASTRTAGLSPDYAQSLTMADSDSPSDIARSIESALGAASDSHAAEQRRRFVSSRSWPIQARRFIDFVAHRLDASRTELLPGGP